MVVLQDANVLVLGLGSSGLAMARWCTRQGARVTVADTRAAPPQLLALQTTVPTAHCVHAALDARLLQGDRPDLLLKSPGLTPAQVAPVLDAAGAVGIPVAGELDLFALALAELQSSRSYQPRILAITGTNGKTTVASLTAQLVARAGKSVALAGNIGPTLLDTLAQHLDQDTLPEVWVLELSSFQLADMAPQVLLQQGADSIRLEAAAACVLNLSQDHLDWHGDMAAYAAAKSQVFGTQALMAVSYTHLTLPTSDLV